MIAVIHDGAEDDLEGAFDFYQAQRKGLGEEFLEEFRRGLDYIVEFPNAWPSISSTHRQYRMNRFPFGIVYRIDFRAGRVTVVAVTHLARKPGWWKKRMR